MLLCHEKQQLCRKTNELHERIFTHFDNGQKSEKKEVSVSIKHNIVNARPQMKKKNVPVLKTSSP